MTTLEKIHLVSSTAISTTNQTRPVADNHSAITRQELAASGKSVPTTDPAGVIEDTRKKELDKAIKNVEGYVQNITRELHFSVDEDLEKPVVKVMDQKTGEVIRQIPTEDMLELSKTLSEVKERASKGLLFQGDA